MKQQTAKQIKERRVCFINLKSYKCYQFEELVIHAGSTKSNVVYSVAGHFVP